MTIEGIGKKFEEARRARNLTLDEAARMTKIRPARLAEIEADDFSQFPSLAYAKGFLLIYGKFLDVDVTPYLEAFEDSEHVTVDGYSYLQENHAPKQVSAPIVRPSRRDRMSPMPLIFGILVLVVGFSVMKLILNVQRIVPRATEPAPQVSPSASAISNSATASPSIAAEKTTNDVAPAPSISPSATVTRKATAVAAATAPPISPSATVVQKATAVAAATPVASEPEVRRAEPARPEDLAKARGAANSAPAESAGPNRVAIRPLKRTYIKVTVDNEKGNPAVERWISPTDGTVEFRGQHISVRVLDPDAVQIIKNGKALEEGDDDVTVN
jgi:cytoskeleton protein RodZ